MLLRLLVLIALLAVAGGAPQAVAAGAPPPVDFSPLQVVSGPAGAVAGPLAVADVTGDGRRDVIAAGSGPSLSVLAGNGDGTFGAPTVYALPGYDQTPFDLATGLVDRSGRAEVAVAAYAGVVLVTPATGAVQLLPETGPAWGVAVADVNGDGLPDLVASTDYGLKLYPGSAGGLGAPSTISPWAYGHPLVGDLGNGRADILARSSRGPLEEFRQEAGGSFTRIVYRFGPDGLALGDFNGDGRLDLAASTSQNDPHAVISIYPGQPDGTLGPRVAYGAYELPGLLVAADMNGDGRTDLVVAHGGWDEIGVLPQQPGGVLAREQLFNSSTSYSSDIPGMATGDLDGDGKPDVVVYDGSLNLLRQNGSGAADTRTTATTITGGPSGVVSSSSATFTFSSNAANPLFQCSLDGASASVCPGGNSASYSNLAPGEHTFAVRTSDSATGPEPLFEFHNWYVQQAPSIVAPPIVPPDTQLTSGPPPSTTSTSASFTFSASGGGIYYQCALDLDPARNTSWQACPGPDPGAVSYTGLAVGTHTFYVRAEDADFNPDPTPASETWTITSSSPPPSPPTVTITSAPQASTTSTSASFSFSSNDQAATFACSLDGAAFAGCSSPTAYSNLATGSHSFQVKATDSNGTSSPASYRWTITTPASPPSATITSSPPATTSSTSTSFGFTSDDAGATFKCALDSAAFTACTSPTSYTNLAVGGHTFHVEATNTNGTGTPARYSWTIQPLAPAPQPPPSSGGGGGGSSGIPPDLHVEVTASGQTAPAVGAELDYVITVSTKNSGGASETTLKLTLPAGYIVTGTSADRGPGCSGTAPNLTCDTAFINPTATTHLRITGTVGQAGEEDLTATASSYPEPELDATDNTVTLKLLPPVPAPTPTRGGTGTTAGAFTPPAIKGTARVGHLLRLTPPTWSSTPTRVRYQWQLCTKIRCAGIPHATKLTLELLPGYAGHTVRLAAVALIDGRAIDSYSRKILIRR